MDWSWLRIVGLVLLVAGSARAQQNLGHKLPGTLGLEAGSQPAPGVYLADRLVFYRSEQLLDRNGQPLPVGFELEALANGFGLAGVLALPPLGGFVTIAMSFPLARVRASTTLPEASADRFGFGDLFVQPARLGWRLPRVDLVAGYAFYAPTGHFEPRGSGVGQGHWTHEVSAGGAVTIGPARNVRVGALASLAVNGRKHGIDITRGSTLQVQGGLGVKLLELLEVGLAGYALWQVTDDTGSALPPVLAGARDRIFGLGPEVDVTLPPLRTRLTLRWAHDVGVESRPAGWLAVVGLTYAP